MVTDSRTAKGMSRHEVSEAPWSPESGAISELAFRGERSIVEMAAGMAAR